MTRKIMIAAVSAACLAGMGAECMGAQAAFPEEKLFDCSSDLQEYTEMIAGLNRLADSGDAAQAIENMDDGISEDAPEEIAKVGECLEEENAAGMYAVLLKTAVPSPEKLPGFLTDDLACMAAGPDMLYTIYYTSEKAADAAVEFWEAQEGTIYAERDSEVHASAVSDELSDTLSDSAGSSPAGAALPVSDYSFRSWGAESMHFGTYLPYAGTWGNGQTVAAVIDSGICSHEILDPRIIPGGYDYVDADDDPSNDLLGHGTHVAGIIVDCTYDLPVYLYPLRVLNATGGGKMSNVALAVRNAIDKNVDVINLSMEGSNISSALDEAIRKAVEEGITVVCSAGNNNKDTSSISPAHLEDEGVIVVGAASGSGRDYVKASYSNFGASVDVYAFGTSILSCSITGGYVTDSGTSMSAPHISALSAMLHLIHPGMLPEETEYRIKTGAAGYTEVKVPDLSEMVPASKGFYLEELVLNEGESVPVPDTAFPAAACENITYVSSNPSVAAAAGGMITACSEGNAVITAACTGFSSVQFNVVVRNNSEFGTLHLPAGLVKIEEEAFSGLDQIEEVSIPEGVLEIGESVLEDCEDLRLVWIPDSVETIGDNTFSGAVLLCGAGSPAMAYAEENALQYIGE